MMKYKHYIQQLLVFMMCCISTHIAAMNVPKPHEIFLRPEFDLRKRFYTTIWAETGLDAKGFNGEGNRVNVLRIWNENQNALAMLDGFDPSSNIGQLRASLLNDDGIRGHFKVNGTLDVDFGFNFAAHYRFLQSLFLGVYLPVYRMKLKDVVWQEQTKDIETADRLVKENLTNNFFENVKELGDGLDLLGWKRTGVGDLTILLFWLKDYWQAKPFLKNVRLDGRIGLSLPTGLRRDEDKIFAIPFGNDGATGLIFGGGLQVTLGRYIKAGIDVELTHRFGNTRNRRIKTDKDQTELLLLQKTHAFKDFGLIQQFTLYAQAHKFFEGLSLKAGYQFLKQGDDTLSLSNNSFSSDIANTAESLKERTMHQMLFQASYDFNDHLDDDASVIPHFALFAQVPFTGKRVAISTLIGGMISLDF